MFGQSDRDYFDKLWKRKVDEDASSAEYLPGENSRVDEALERLHSGNRLLDIGCGSGILLSVAKDRFREVYGIDISESAVSLARQKNIQAYTINLNVDRIPYPDGFFDAVTILSTLQYFYDMDRVLQECMRVLSPAGVLLLSVPNIRAIWRIARLLVGGYFTGVSLDLGNYDGGTLHYFATSNVKELLSRNGFSVVLAKGIFCRPSISARFTDRGMIGTAKREFFSAEIFVVATKNSQGHLQK